MKHALILIGVILLSAGCKPFSDSVIDSMDAKSFSLFGGALFSSFEEVSIKQLLLDTPNLIDRKVIVEGEVLDIGEYSTYMVINDDSSKLLVVLSEIDVDPAIATKSKRVKVLGCVESGKKGAPYVKAKSVRVI